MWGTPGTWLPGLLLVLVFLQTANCKCYLSHAEWRKGAPVVTHPNKNTNKVLVNWSTIINDNECADKFVIWVWKDGQTQKQGRSTTITDVNTLQDQVAIEPCFWNNIMVELTQKGKTKSSEVARYNSATIPTFDPADVKIGYYKDPRTGQYDLSKASIKFGDQLLQFASCIKHVEVSGQQGSRPSSGVTTPRTTTRRSRSRTTTVSSASRTATARSFFWGQNLQESNTSMWQPYGTGRQVGGLGVPPVGTWATSHDHGEHHVHGQDQHGQGQREQGHGTARPPATTHRPSAMHPQIDLYTSNESQDRWSHMCSLSLENGNEYNLVTGRPPITPKSCANDDARSAIIQSAKKGTIIYMFDSPKGTVGNDDWAKIEVLKDITSPITINSFQKNLATEYIKLTFHQKPGGKGYLTLAKNQLDGKVSMIKVDTSKTGTDGNWAGWADWTPCSKTCGGGTSTRKRTCTNPAPSRTGKDCVGSRSEEKKCAENSCRGPSRTTARPTARPVGSGGHHRPTGGWSYPTSTPKPHYPHTTNRPSHVRRDFPDWFHPGQQTPGFWKQSSFGNVFPHKTTVSAKKTTPVTKALPANYAHGDEVEVVVNVDPCDQYTFEMKIVNKKNEELGKVTGIKLPILADIQDYVPPPLTSVIGITYPSGKSGPVLGNSGNAIPPNCIPFYLEAVDTFANRLESIANFQSFDTKSIDKQRSGIQGQVEVTQEETLAKFGCKCTSPHLELKTTDDSLWAKHGKAFGHYHYRGMYLNHPYYKLGDHDHVGHHDPHGTGGHRHKRFIGNLNQQSTTTSKPWSMYGTHRPSCATVCALSWKPLCGNDGKLYSNECMMNSASCKATNAGGQPVTMAKKCSPSGVCKCDAVASQGSNCGKICTLDWKPVCGSDGKMYSNECQLNSANCKPGTSITLAKRCPTGTCKCSASGVSSQGSFSRSSSHSSSSSVSRSSSRSSLSRSSSSSSLSRSSSQKSQASHESPASHGSQGSVQVPMYLYWDPADKQWVFGLELGDKQVNLGSKTASLAKCPADPQNTVWQVKDRSWADNAAVKLICEDHA